MSEEGVGTWSRHVKTRFPAAFKARLGVCGGQRSLHGLFPGQKPAGTRQPLGRSNRNEYICIQRVLEKKINKKNRYLISFSLIIVLPYNNLTLK